MYYVDEVEEAPKRPSLKDILTFKVNRRASLAVCAVAVASIAFTVVLGSSASPTESITVLRGIQYSPVGWAEPLKADIVRPALGVNHPVVILVHGGSWIAGTREDMMGWAEALAGRGYLAVTIDYRLLPKWHYPAPQRDLDEALRWVKVHAAEYGGDSTRIGLFGFSAGAQIVALEGVRPADGLRQVRAIATLGLPSEMWKFKDPQESIYVGGDPARDYDLFRLASPAADVTAGVPAFLLIHGKNDTEVPLEQSLDMARALTAVQDETKVFLLDDEGHVPSSGGRAKIAARMIDFFDQSLMGRAG